MIAQGDLLRPSAASVVHCSEALRVGYPTCKRTTRPLPVHWCDPRNPRGSLFGHHAFGMAAQYT